VQVTQTLRKAAQVGSDRPLTIFGNRTRTAGEVVDRVRRAAAVLPELGVAPATGSASSRSTPTATSSCSSPLPGPAPS